jgi:hypothetical protein
MEAVKKHSDNQRVKKPAPPQIQNKEHEQEPLGHTRSVAGARRLDSLPSGPGTKRLRQAAVLQMQKTHGNAHVMRQIDGREHEEAHVAAGGSSTSIGDGGSSVTAEGGTVDIDGAAVNINAAMTQTSGIFQAGTIIADSVIASSYTPGAGNIY